MKTFISSITFLFLFIGSAQAQTGIIGNISINTHADKYSVQNTYDTTFARTAAIELDDTVNIGTVEIILFNLNTSEEISSQSFVYTNILTNPVYTSSFTLSRQQKLLQFFMGERPFTTRYRITVKLKDLNNTYSGQRIFEF